MPTCKEALEYYKKAVKDGKGDMHTGHPFISEEEEQKRQDNAPDATGRQKTKISFDSNDPDSYAEWHKERARWMKAAQKNPTLSTDAMIVALRSYSEEGINAIIEVLGAERAKLEAAAARAAGIPAAVIPPATKQEDLEPLLRRSIMMADARR